MTKISNAFLVMIIAAITMADLEAFFGLRASNPKPPGIVAVEEGRRTTPPVVRPPSQPRRVQPPPPPPPSRPRRRP